MGGHFNEQYVQAVIEGKWFCIVGDNVNLMVTASHQRKGNSTHMEHRFASAAITLMTYHLTFLKWLFSTFLGG
jgi:hypothetical protein